MNSNIQKPLVIPLFLPNFGCPHRCIFCDQKTITAQKHPSLLREHMQREVANYLTYKGKRRGRVQISFYGGNFLGMESSLIRSLLEDATCFIRKGDVDSLRFSTRPDTIAVERLDLLCNYPVSTIELGVQTMNDEVLRLIRRGHSARDTEEAVYLLKQYGYEIGLQMMVGLPGESPESSMETARQIVALSPDFVRIYPTVVLAGSPLAAWYTEGTYAPMRLSSCVSLVKELYALFSQHHIPVIRMGLQANELLKDSSNVLAGPYHPAFGHLVLSEFFLDKTISAIDSTNTLPDEICIRVHPQNTSKLRGFKNRNLGILTERFKIAYLKILPDNSLETDDVIVSSL